MIGPATGAGTSSVGVMEGPTRAAEEARPEREAEVLRFPSTTRPPAQPHPEPEPLLRDVLGDVLREERRRQGRSLADVAETAAVSLPYLSEVERGRKEVSSDLLDAIATSLDLPLVEILERSAQRLRFNSAIGSPLGTLRSGEPSAGRRSQRTAVFQLAA